MSRIELKYVAETSSTMMDQVDDSKKTKEQLIAELEQLRAELDDRKRMEEALRRSNALLQAQREASVAGIWVVNEHRELLFYNQRFCEIWQIPPAIIATNDYWKIFNAALTQLKDVDTFLMTVEALYQSPDAISHDEVVLKNGRVLDRRSAPMRSPTGEYYGRVWYFQDITEAKQLEAFRNQAQQALSQSQERYVLATRAARIGVWEGNHRTGEFYLDPNFKFLLGYSDIDIPNHFDAWFSIFHPDDRLLVVEAAQGYLKKQTAEFAVEHRVFHRDGSIRWVMARGMLVQNDSDRMVGTTTDITERKLAEQTLQRSNAALKVQQEAALDGILITNEHQLITSYNQRFCQLWHLDEALILNAENDRQVRETVLDQLKDPNAFLRKIDYLNQHPEITCRDEILFEDGRIFDRYSAAIKSSTGEDYGRIWYFRDITEIKQTEAALRQNEQKFLQLTENIRDAFFIAAPDYSQMFYISPAYEAIWGRTCSSLYHDPQSWLEAVHPDDRSSLFAALQTRGNPVEQGLEYRIVQPNGDVRWVLTRTFPIFDETGHVHRVAGIGRDITELKQIEAELKQYQEQLEALVVERTKELNEANQQLQQELQQRTQTEATLRESERRWRTLMEDVRLLVVGFDTYLNITYANPFLAEVTGYSQAELIGKNWLDVFALPSQILSLPIEESDFFVKSFRVHHQESLLTKAGEVRQVAWNCTLLHNAQGEVIGFLSIGEDITERAFIERMKDEFISVVSHEFRTPLTAIHGALDLLLDGLVEWHSDRAQQLLTIAFDGSERLVHLVDSILALERLESGDVKLLKQPCQLADLMMKAIDLTQLMAANAGVDLVVSPLAMQLELDGDRILQVLTNLLSNAIKFSPSGSTVWLSAALRAGDRGESGTARDNAFSAPPISAPTLLSRPGILLSVKDQGRGIPSDKLETIFERFQQVDTSDSRQKGGTGLGLTICRSIVQQHQGRIWAESTIGEGSCFYVLLPVDDPD